MMIQNKFSMFQLLGAAALVAGVGTLGCSDSGDGTSDTVVGTSTGVGTTTGGDDGTIGGGLNPNTGTDVNNAGPREAECTTDADGNEVCVCIKIATWGGLGTYGANWDPAVGMPVDGQDAISEWLNANSTGAADYAPEKTFPINAETLGNYDVIILQNLENWPAFTADELAAFEGWVRGGGGVIALNGYSANGLEMTNVNQLLAFSGLGYIPDSDTVAENYVNPPACQDECYGSSAPMGGWLAEHPISLNIKDVGAYHGRSINAGAGVAGGAIVAQTAEGILGATVDVDAGHIFMFHDEWVTYNSQWTGAGLAQDCRTYDAGHQCAGMHPVEDYSSAQFWYNSLLWSSGNPECFDIVDPQIIK